MKTKKKNYLNNYILLLKLFLLLSIFTIGTSEKQNHEESIPEYVKGHIITCKINSEDWFHY